MKEEYKILRFQNNLRSLRTLAGWTAKEIGEKIGVTKQTILTLEKQPIVRQMSKLQYIGLRTMFELEAASDTENAALLKAVLSKLLDSEMTEEEMTDYETQLKMVAALVDHGVDTTAVRNTLNMESDQNNNEFEEEVKNELAKNLEKNLEKELQHRVVYQRDDNKDDNMVTNVSVAVAGATIGAIIGGPLGSIFGTCLGMGKWLKDLDEDR